MLGFVPEQLAQKRLVSTFVTAAVTLGVKVCPIKDVLLNPYPDPKPLSSACWSRIFGPPEATVSLTSPGLEAISTLVPVPVVKSPKFVSVKQLLELLGVSARSCTVVLPPLTTTPLTETAL